MWNTLAYEAPVFVEKTADVGGSEVAICIFIDRPRKEGFFYVQEKGDEGGFYDQELNRAIKRSFNFKMVFSTCHLNNPARLGEITNIIADEIIKIL